MTSPSRFPAQMPSQGQSQISGNGVLLSTLYYFLYALFQRTGGPSGILPGSPYNVENFDAVGDGVTDDVGAFNRALQAASAAGGGVVLVPLGNYRLSAGITVPDFVTLQGEGFQAGRPDDPTPGKLDGSKLIFDTSVMTCVTVSSGDYETAALREIIVTRAGAIPAGSIGVLVDRGDEIILDQVYSENQAIGFKFFRDQVGTGLGCMANLLFTHVISDAHVVVDNWAELRCTQSRFGCNGPGDLASQCHVRITGGRASGPALGANAIYFDHCFFDSGVGAVTNMLEFVALAGTPGATTIFSFTSCHTENVTHVVAHDGSGASFGCINELQIVNSTLFNSGDFWNLTGNVVLINMRITGCALLSAFTLNPGLVTAGLLISGTSFDGAVSITGAASSYAAISGCTFTGNVTVTGGAWTGLFLRGVMGNNALTLTNTATGNVDVTIIGH